MNKSFWITIVTLVVVIVCLYYWVVTYSPRVDDDSSQLLEKMELLNNKVDSIKRANDSIRIIIDTTDVEIEHVYEKYIQVREHIVTQSVDSDCVFFSDYLSSNSRRFIDTINFETTERN